MALLESVCLGEAEAKVSQLTQLMCECKSEKRAEKEALVLGDLGKIGVINDNEFYTIKRPCIG